MSGATPRRPAPLAASGSPVDQLGRSLSDLRLSVTDRCNFRCRYCMPRESLGKSSFLPRTEILRFEEIVRVARVFVQAGVRKVRLTGGEPLMRRELPRLVEQLAALPVDLALTTNGVLLPQQAQDLARAGLGRLTVSLDALDEEVFQRVSDAPGFTARDVLRGIEAAETAGFGPVKINCVVRKGVNESQVLPLLEHFEGSGHILRFIEFMDVGTRNGWGLAEVVTRQQLHQRLSVLGELSPLPAKTPHEVAERYRFRRGKGAQKEGPATELGIIASVSRPFCSNCSRARLSADGKLYSCLFSGVGHDLRETLRSGCSDDSLRRDILEWWSKRSDRYSEQRASHAEAPRRLPLLKAEMSYIGG